MESEGEETQTLRQKAENLLRHLPGAALFFAVITLVVCGYLGWYHYGAEHLNQALYALKRENLKATAKPGWIKTDIVQEVFENNRLDRVSLLDPSATATIAQAFETHDWVRSANRVAKSAGGVVEVDLIYRKPAAMVYCDPNQSQPAARGSDGQAVVVTRGVFPIDEESVVLPTEHFDPDRVHDFFTIFAKGTLPAGEIGMHYGDVRIAEALKLVAFLSDVRERLGLSQIYVSRESRRTNSQSPWEMTIITENRRQVIWGHVPEAEPASEPSAEQKYRKMAAWLAETSGEEEVAPLDLRQNGGLPVSARNLP